MRATLAALCLLAGCRQVLGLEPSVLNDASSPTDGGADGASIDAAGCGTGDFDGDGLTDNCDPCPHIASTNADADGDGVGDLCDPRPATAGDTRVQWLSFASASEVASWTDPTNAGAWSVVAHRLHEANTVFTTLDSPTTYTTDIHFATSVLITQPSTNEVGFCAANLGSGVQYYCCGIANGTSGKATVRAVSQYGGGPQVSSAADLGTQLVASDEVKMLGTLAAGKFTCKFTRQNSQNTTVMTPAENAMGPVSFYTTTPVDYRYVFVVTMAP